MLEAQVDARPRWRPFRSVRLQILASMLAVAAAGMLVAGTTAFLVQRASILAGVESRLTDVIPDVSFIALDSGGLARAGGEVVWDLREAFLAMELAIRGLERVSA